MKQRAVPAGAVEPGCASKWSSQLLLLRSATGLIIGLFIYDLIVTLINKSSWERPSKKLMTRLTFDFPTAYEASGRVLKKYSILLINLSFKRNVFLGVIILV